MFTNKDEIKKKSAFDFVKFKPQFQEAVKQIVTEKIW